MKILVCVKQVPDMLSSFRLNPEKTWLDERDLAFRMNEYDEYAVEQAVRVKEQNGNAPDITVLSIGPARVLEVLKKALAVGADRGVHIRDEQVQQKDPFQIASIIAEFARDKGFDLIFTGFQSQDRGSAQVGLLVAELLGLPCVTTAVAFELSGSTATVRRELEGGLKAVIKFDLPGVVTCQLGLNTLRYPTLPSIMKARQKEMLVLQAADLLKTGPLLVTDKLFSPEKKTSGLVLEGDLNDMADRLVALLKEKTTVLK